MGHYLAIEAWTRGLDCIILERSDINAYLMLERVEKTHLQWLREDIGPWFKYQTPLYRKRTGTFSVLLLSRVELREELIKPTMPTQARLELLNGNGIRTGLLFNTSETVRLGVDEVLPHLTALAAGLKEP
jgi:hypothetical protein